MTKNEYREDDIGQSLSAYEAMERQWEAKNLAWHSQFMTGREDVDAQELEAIAAGRYVTHIRPIPLMENTPACQGLQFLTRDAKGNVYETLHLEPLAEIDDGWVELKESFQAQADKYCWQSDGGSVWYASWEDPYGALPIILIVRGSKEDTEFGKTIDEHIYRQYYNENIQQIAEVKE